MRHIRIVVLLFIVIASYTVSTAQYSPLRIESRENQLRRQIERAKLERQLDDIRNGRVPTNYNEQNNNPHETIQAEIHVCSNNGYHNTSYEPHCFDMYFNSDGSVYWDRRKYDRTNYNNSLTGRYYLQQSGYNHYDLHIVWDNGSRTDGFVEYKGTIPEFNFDGHVFTAR